MYGMYCNKLISTKVLIKQSLDQLDYTNSDGEDLLYYVNNPHIDSYYKESNLSII